MSKEKQIEEMATDISEVQNGGWKFVGDSEYTTDVYNEELAEHLYNAGYRKQSEGEWVRKDGFFVCSVCDTTKPFCVLNDNIHYYACNYCHKCGAKMKGGGE